MFSRRSSDVLRLSGQNNFMDVRKATRVKIDEDMLNRPLPPFKHQDYGALHIPTDLPDEVVFDDEETELDGIQHFV